MPCSLFSIPPFFSPLLSSPAFFLLPPSFLVHPSIFSFVPFLRLLLVSSHQLVHYCRSRFSIRYVVSSSPLFFNKLFCARPILLFFSSLGKPYVARIQKLTVQNMTLDSHSMPDHTSKHSVMKRGRTSTTEQLSYGTLSLSSSPLRLQRSPPTRAMHGPPLRDVQPAMDKLSLNLPPSDSPTNIASPEEPSSPSSYLRRIRYCEDLHLSVDLPATPRIDWRSMIVIYILTVVAEAARGLLLPSSWPYFRSLGGSKADFGFIVAAYSLGRMLSTTPLGYLSDTMSCASVLVIASYIQAFGNLLYAISPNLTILYLSRIIVGFGSATTSIARAHIAKSVPQSIRTTHFAYMSGLQFVGIAVLPAFGGMLSLLPHANFGPVMLNGYTYPAHLLFFANLACVPLIYKYYCNPSVTPPPSPLSPRSAPSSPQASFSIPAPSDRVPLLQPRQVRPSFVRVETQPKADLIALMMCLLINVVFRGILAALETVSIPFLMEQYSVTYGFASICMTAIGILGVVTYFSLRFFVHKVSDRKLVLLGLIAIAVGCVPLSVPYLVNMFNVVLYVILLAFTWSVAYPIGQTAILSLYSKILAGLHVGGLIGLFSTSGALSPLFLSIVASKLWEDSGRESVFRFIVQNVIVALFVLVASYKRLVPPSLPC